MTAALYENDLDRLLSYTHPVVVEAMGGALQAKEGLKQAISAVQAKDMKLESLDFPTAPTFLETDQREFAIVPTLSIITINGQRIESLNYQFGTRSVGNSDWKYFEGSRVNKDNVQKVFPGFPADYEFPPIHRKKLE